MNVKYHKFYIIRKQCINKFLCNFFFYLKITCLSTEIIKYIKIKEKKETLDRQLKCTKPFNL